MENATVTETPRDWRQSWREFTELVGRRGDDADSEVAQAVQAELQEDQDGTFHGFGSPRGRF